jgi:hypothetical protein
MPSFLRPNSEGEELREAWSVSAREASIASKKESEDSTRASIKKRMQNLAYQNEKTAIRKQNTDIKKLDKAQRRYFGRS